MPFHCKLFSIEQSKSIQKIGADSMLLGAWTEGNAKSILDVGTGTGILALMQAQKYPKASVIAIEPDLDSFEEASYNFEQSIFKDRLQIIHTSLQHFEAIQPFDLIISNPPYFEDDFLSEDTKRNSARHTITLSIEELYSYDIKLLSETGLFYLVFPETVAKQHYDIAKAKGLNVKQVLLAKTEDGMTIRHFVCFSKQSTACTTDEIIIKYKNGLYSKKYVELTKDFYSKTLAFYQDEVI